MSSEQSTAKISAIAKRLKLPVLAEFQQHISREQNFTQNLLQLLELEVLEKENRGIQRRTKAAGFPVIRMLDTFKFDAERLPHLHKEQVWELAECHFIKERRNVLAIGNSGMGKTHLGIAFGIEAISTALVDRLIHRAEILNMNGESYRLYDAKSEIISSLSGGMKNAKKNKSPRTAV